MQSSNPITPAPTETTGTTGTAGTTGITETTPFRTEAATRRATRRNRLVRRRRLILAGALVAVGAIAGTGLTVNSSLAAQRVAETDALTQSTGLAAEQLGAYAGVAEAKVHAEAEDTLTLAADTLSAVEGKIDAEPLASSVATLGDYEVLPIDEVRDLTRSTRAEIQKAEEAAKAHDQEVAAREAAEALARANTPEGAKQTARAMAASQYGWGEGEFQCLVQLWTKESGWNYQAENASSGAFGIVQALPAEKLATAGADWRTNAATQIKWGLDYIARGYGTPCSAWGHSQSVNWY
ncbi:aggregation-promoting factor C-terminal-like domain-containing protein [Agromyces sp. M3QZ16-3]|uniref:aggregation-promoting factor C-terminal-like domain-containing protein n=1 Tax=Agromyces sp. M3QZ16-3 TaxID=3447585 RepID=UPI003F69249C